MNFCGDFLQLPPVDKDGTRKSLALPLDEKGYQACAPDDADADVDVAESQDRNQQALLEGRQGFELWRSISRVVCLNVNVRAPGVLSRLQSEMRAGHISDEMWELYLSRIVEPNDRRLTDSDSPFANNSMHFVVHRHRIRVMRALENAKEQSRKLNVPLFILQASDQAVRVEDEAKLTPALRAELLQRVNPDKTKGLPSFLPLYLGMRLFLTSKDCVRFGIMKGCPCILRDIVFSDFEILPQVPVSGYPYSIQYMPVSLLLQVEDVEWSLPKTELPEQLPANVDRRGLFQLRPSFDHLSLQVGIEYVSIRRTTFLATPADTITVYAAQGSTFDAVVADMQRPPRLDASKHWLACYVMLSRARSLEGFLVLRPATRAELSARPPQYLVDELERLQRLENTSLHELVDYINSLPMETPANILELFDKDAAAAECRRVNEHRARVMQTSTVANPTTPPARSASRKNVPLTPPPMTPPSKRRRLTFKQSPACASKHVLRGNAPGLGCVPHGHARIDTKAAEGNNPALGYHSAAPVAATAVSSLQGAGDEDAPSLAFESTRFGIPVARHLNQEAVDNGNNDSSLSADMEVDDVPITEHAESEAATTTAASAHEGQRTRDVLTGTKPRPFYNASEFWGAGSCFINAALQLLFASTTVRSVLRQILDTLSPHLQGHGTELWQFCDLASTHEIRGVDHAGRICNVEAHSRVDAIIAGANAQHSYSLKDVYLALTFASAMKGRSVDGVCSLDRPLYPALILREHYKGRDPQQEDASMFLMECLKGTQTLNHFYGSYEVPCMICEKCGYQSLAASHGVERFFNTLVIGTDRASVCAAITATYTSKLDEVFNGCCSNPECQRRLSHKVQPIEEPPTVLLLQVNRWNFENPLRPRRVETDIRAPASNRQADV